MAGLALCLSAAACDGGGEERGPPAPNEGETAALLDAEAMLDEREPAENLPESSPGESVPE